MVSTTKETGKSGDRQPKIMTKPLPEILDDLENYIMRVEEAVRMAQAAAGESREAATEARISGQKAAQAAKIAAESTVAKVKEEASQAMQTLSTMVANIESDLSVLRDKVSQEALALEHALSAAQEKHRGESPFLNP